MDPTDPTHDCSCDCLVAPNCPRTANIVLAKHAFEKAMRMTSHNFSVTQVYASCNNVKPYCSYTTDILRQDFNILRTNEQNPISRKYVTTSHQTLQL